MTNTLKRIVFILTVSTAALAATLSLTGCSSTCDAGDGRCVGCRPFPAAADVTRVVVNCAGSLCSSPAGARKCTDLSVAVVSCLASGPSPAACLADLPSLLAVGYAEVACVVAGLAEGSPRADEGDQPVVRAAASRWLSEQRVTVRR